MLFHTSENDTVNVELELLGARMPVVWLLTIEFLIVAVLLLNDSRSMPTPPLPLSVQFTTVNVVKAAPGTNRIPASPMLRDRQFVSVGDALPSTRNPTVPASCVPTTRTPL